MPYEEQKGYQTHYLLIGVELLHPLTGREDVAAAYVRAVDWFCGGPGSTDPGFALQQHYGIVCRHLAYAWRLTGHRPYLEIARTVPRAAHGDAGLERRPRRGGLRGHEPHGSEPAVLRGPMPAGGAGRGGDGGAGGLASGDRPRGRRGLGEEEARLVAVLELWLSGFG